MDIGTLLTNYTFRSLLPWHDVMYPERLTLHHPAYILPVFLTVRKYTRNVYFVNNVPKYYPHKSHVVEILVPQRFFPWPDSAWFQSRGGILKCTLLRAWNRTHLKQTWRGEQHLPGTRCGGMDIFRELPHSLNRCNEEPAPNRSKWKWLTSISSLHPPWLDDRIFL